MSYNSGAVPTYVQDYNIPAVGRAYILKEARTVQNRTIEAKGEFYIYDIVGDIYKIMVTNPKFVMFNLEITPDDFNTLKEGNNLSLGSPELFAGRRKPGDPDPGAGVNLPKGYVLAANGETVLGPTDGGRRRYRKASRKHRKTAKRSHRKRKSTRRH